MSDNITVSEFIEKLRRFPCNAKVSGVSGVVVDASPYSTDCGCTMFHACCRNDQLPDVLRAAAEREDETTAKKIFKEYAKEFSIEMDKYINDPPSMPVQYGVELVVVEDDDIARTEFSQLRWSDWDNAAEFGESMVSMGKAKGFRIFTEAAV